jgi:hypothetical protein
VLLANRCFEPISSITPRARELRYTQARPERDEAERDGTAR